MLMLRFIDQLINQPILGIRGGRQLALTLEPILDPRKLKIEAFYSQVRTSQDDMVLFTSDIRELGSLGIIVDSEDVIMPTTDLVRLEELIDLNFDLLGKLVVTESGDRLGKVDNYAVDDLNFKIEKIYAKPTGLKALNKSDFVIARRQVANVNNKEVVVKDAFVKKESRQRSPSLNPLGS